MPEDKDRRPTETQERPNISTEHQEQGDARRPRDVLDRTPERGPAGQTLPSEDAGVPGGQPPEPVEDRPQVGEVSPDDYPDSEGGKPDYGRNKP